MRSYSDAFSQKKYIQDFWKKIWDHVKIKKGGPYKHPLPEPEKKRDLIDPH